MTTDIHLLASSMVGEGLTKSPFREMQDRLVWLTGGSVKAEITFAILSLMPQNQTLKEKIRIIDANMAQDTSHGNLV